MVVGGLVFWAIVDVVEVQWVVKGEIDAVKEGVVGVEGEVQGATILKF